GRREIQPFTGETVRISIPKGVRDGFRIKLSGRGEPSPTGRGEAGDLYITFQVAAHDRFTREGDDLVVTETVSALDAMLGTTREVTTADGKTVRLKVKPGTQPGTRLRVRGQGVETAARRGDLYVVVHVHVPTLSQDTREALRRWAEAHGLAGAD
ncbi:MAG: J domain-containing protein, partial [Bacteroidota bacterium]